MSEVSPGPEQNRAHEMEFRHDSAAANPEYKTTPIKYGDAKQGDVLVSKIGRGAPFEVLSVEKTDEAVVLKVKGLEGTDGTEREWKRNPNASVDLRIE